MTTKKEKATAWQWTALDELEALQRALRIAESHDNQEAAHAFRERIDMLLDELEAELREGSDDTAE